MLQLLHGLMDILGCIKLFSLLFYMLENVHT